MQPGSWWRCDLGMPPTIGAPVAVSVAGGGGGVDRLETEVRLELDVTDPESCARFVEEAVAGLGGGVDILFNNAGLSLGRDPFWKSTEEDERTVLETNVNGLIRMTRL